MSVSPSLWNGTEWAETDTLMTAPIDGDPRLDEISEAEARQLRPAAFQ